MAERIAAVTRGLLLLSLVVALPALVQWAADPLLALVAAQRAGRPPTFEPLLLACASAALLVCAGWISLAVAAGALEMLTGRAPAPARRLTPLAVRRAVLLACGAAVGPAVLVTTATADGADAGRPASATMLAGLPLPDRTTGPFHPTAERNGVLPGHLVRRGDSLWRIAAHLVAPDGSDRAVAEATRALYRANRATIGADPDLLLPGQHLALPHTLHREDAP